MAILDQLFGQQQPQQPDGMVQQILSQRFQPSPQDAASAMLQTATTAGHYVDPSTVMQQRIAPGMDVATRLAAIQQQGAQTQGLNLANQMQQFQMPYMQEMYKQMYGGGQPVGFPQGGQQQPQGNAVGFPDQVQGNQPPAIDPRQKEARMASMMGNKSLADTDMAIYNADPDVIANKAEATKTGENSAANILQASKADELTKRLGMNLNAMLEINPNVPSSGLIPASVKVWASQAQGANDMGDMGAGARAAHQWDQINNQQILSEIQQFIASGGANTRTNQTLERIVRAASGIDRDALPADREAQIKNALSEIQNKNISAGNLAGGKQSYVPIPVNTANPPGAGLGSGQPQTQTINGQTFVKRDGAWYHQ